MEMIQGKLCGFSNKLISIDPQDILLTLKGCNNLEVFIAEGLVDVVKKSIPEREDTKVVAHITIPKGEDISYAQGIARAVGRKLGSVLLTWGASTHKEPTVKLALIIGS